VLGKFCTEYQLPDSTVALSTSTTQHRWQLQDNKNNAFVTITQLHLWPHEMLAYFSYAADHPGTAWPKPKYGGPAFILLVWCSSLEHTTSITI